MCFVALLINQITGETCKIWQTRQAQTLVLLACLKNLNNKITVSKGETNSMQQIVIYW